MSMFNHNSPIWWYNYQQNGGFPLNSYITEDASTAYVAEDGVTPYVTET